MGSADQSPFKTADMGNPMRDILNSRGRSWKPLANNMQKALDDLPIEGGTVWLPHKLIDKEASAPILLDGYEKIMGYGTEIKLANGVDDSLFKYRSSSVDQIEVVMRDLLLDGNKANNAAGRALDLYAKRCYFENIRIHDFYESGMWLHPLNNVTGGLANKLIGIWSHENDQHGYRIGSTDNQLIGCVSYSNALHGFNLAASASMLSVCHSWGNTQNGAWIAAPLIEILGGHYEGNTLNGIASGSAGSKSTIKGVHAYNNSGDSVGSYDGIRLQDVVDMILIGNHCRDIRDAGSKRQRYGIVETGTSDYNIIVANNCRENEDATYDIYVAGSNTKEDNNQGRVRLPA